MSSRDDEDDDKGVYVTWYVRLDHDTIMVELGCTGADSVAIWLAYDALADRQNVLRVLTAARQTVRDGSEGGLWDELVRLSGEQPPAA